MYFYTELWPDGKLTRTSQDAVLRLETTPHEVPMDRPTVLTRAASTHRPC